MQTFGPGGHFNADDAIFAYLKGELDEEGKKAFLEWLDTDPANLKYYTEVKAVYNHMKMRPHLTAKHFKEELRRLNSTIDRGESSPRRSRRVVLAGIAASLAVLLVACWAVWNYGPCETVTYETTDGRTEEIVLADGTHVWLKGHSALSYDAGRYSRNRVVELMGEAVFDVTSNPANPFMVNAPGVKVKVLGTVFQVSSFTSDGPSETILAEGAVDLYNAKGAYLVSLNPGQKAVYDSGSLKVKEVKVDDMAMMRYGLHIIRDASLQEIVRTLEDDFNIRLRVASYTSRDTLFTISYVKDAQVSDVLDMVETVTGCKFEIDN